MADEVLGPPRMRLTVIAMRPSRPLAPTSANRCAGAGRRRCRRRGERTRPAHVRASRGSVGSHSVTLSRVSAVTASTRLAGRPERVQLAEEVVREKRCGVNGGCIENTDDLEDDHYADRLHRASATIFQPRICAQPTVDPGTLDRLSSRDSAHRTRGPTGGNAPTSGSALKFGALHADGRRTGPTAPTQGAA